ncbi:MAG: type II secretion system F family protein [Gammaproteobacteria bacterium]|nr:type II secretion system F family protein [Gammaproteobacteria bacterium]
MGQYTYSARARNGNALRGIVEADNINDAADRLLRQGVIPLDIAEHKNIAQPFANFSGKLTARRVTLVDLMFFTRQMRTLLRAGVPIGDALTSLYTSSSNPDFGKVLRELHNQLQSGKTLSQALKLQPRVFTNIYANLIEVGESTGKLPEVFEALGGYLQQEKEIRERITSAVRYPIMVLAMIFVAFIIVNIFVIPVFANMFAKFNAKLPLATRFLIETSRLSKAYWWLWGLLLYAGVRWLRRFLSSTKGRRWWDEKKLKLPIMGNIFLHGALARFAKAFALTIGAGVPMSTGINIIARTVDNAYITEKLMQMRNEIETGKSLSQGIKNTNLFPPLVLQMVTVGEQTGQFEQLIGEVADYYGSELDQSLKALGASIEPILLVIIGIFVMILMMGIFLPLWEMVNAAQGRG